MGRMSRPHRDRRACGCSHRGLCLPLVMGWLSEPLLLNLRWAWLSEANASIRPFGLQQAFAKPDLQMQIMERQDIGINRP